MEVLTSYDVNSAQHIIDEDGEEELQGNPINTDATLHQPSTSSSANHHQKVEKTSDGSFETPAQDNDNHSEKASNSPASSTRNFMEAALVYKIIEEEDGINLNKTPSTEEYCKSLVKKTVCVGSGRLARSPGAANLDFPKVDDDLCESFFDWLSTTNSKELQRPWIMHQAGTYIEISGELMKDQYCNGAALTFDILDAAVRRMRQIDSQMYDKGSTIRWRHWLESNLAIHVLAGDDPTKVIDIREQFIGDSVVHDIVRCRMFVVPLQCNGNWCAYVWDMKFRKIFILDPHFNGENKTETLAKHDKTAMNLHKGFVSCVQGFFQGWEGDWVNWNIKLPSTGCATVDRNETGICTMFLARHFNGDGYATAPTKDALGSFKKTLLYEMMELEGNKGMLPGVYVQKIE